MKTYIITLISAFCLYLCLYIFPNQNNRIDILHQQLDSLTTAHDSLKIEEAYLKIKYNHEHSNS